MEELMTAIEKLKDAFDEAAKEEGDKNTLTKKELGTLLREQLGVSRKYGSQLHSCECFFWDIFLICLSPTSFGV